MIPALLGTKMGMTRILGEGGAVEPVTVVRAGPCVVLQVKTKESDGYDAVQLGFKDVKPHRSTKALIGHAAKAGTGPKHYTREVRLAEPSQASIGDVVTVEQFSSAGVGHVDVTGTTKGKGFQGVMKRHGFGGMPASHGTERKHRCPGGIGSSAPRGTGRSVKKGKRMAGHMGHVRCTISNLPLLKVDAEHDLLLIRGSVPGPAGTLLYVRRAVKKA